MKKTVNLDNIIDSTDEVIRIPVKQLLRLYVENDMDNPQIEICFYRSHNYYEGTYYRFDSVMLTDGENDKREDQYEW